jgi:hypothetical protein
VRVVTFISFFLFSLASGYANLALGAETQPLIKKTRAQQREHVISLLKEFVFRHQTFTRDEVIADVMERIKTDVYLLEALTRSDDPAVHEEFRAIFPEFSKEEILILESRRLKIIQECDDNVYYFWNDALDNPDEPFQKSWKNWMDNPFDALMKGVVMGVYGGIDTVATLYTVPRWLYTCHD